MNESSLPKTQEKLRSALASCYTRKKIKSIDKSESEKFFGKASSNWNVAHEMFASGYYD